MQNATSTLNNGKHITSILDNTTCGKHRVPKGIPCFHIWPGNAKLENALAGVCGGRIKKAGFNGKISPTSLQLKAPGGRGGRKR